MTPQQYERLTELFHAALEIAPERRAAFLDHLSDVDANLQRELASLLATHEQRPAFTEPPEDIAAAYLAQQGDDPAEAPSLTPNTRIDRYEIRSLLGTADVVANTLNPTSVVSDAGTSEYTGLQEGVNARASHLGEEI